MSQLLINTFLNDLDRNKKFSGSLNEGVISEAFKDLLKGWSRQNNLHFVPQYDMQGPQKNLIRLDGAILHDLRVPLGYWEAKDPKDNLDDEIRKKFLKGYPQDNIIFEDSQTAVLIQNRSEVMRCSMMDTGELLRLVTRFFAYERKEIEDFRKAVAQFKQDIPAVLDALRERIDAAYASNVDFKIAANKFLAHAKDTINPSISEDDVREMLIQHILTEEIFAHVFDQGDFHRDNNIAKELYALEAKFFTGQLKRETLKGLETYYATIRSNAALITSHAEKQTFLKVIYENFYKVYNPKAADRLGVVYTPNEIVKFMIEGADWLCQKHFGKLLIDRDVEILDPATGTGTFICELIEHFRGQPEKLAHKYKNELHANEVAILPYYVANLNIEATYAAVSGQYAEFPNLCFVDTLDNVAGLGIRAGQQLDMLGALSDENVLRVKRQNAKKISVIIGNPPYNANQTNENDNNKNRSYTRIDELIKSSYIRLSTAQKTKVYDMYARFFRWASDRMHDDGVLAFVTNRSFIDSRTFDGFRKAAALEFAEIYVMDLGGDVRANPKLSGTKNNVFGIQTGVAISFLIKRIKHKDCKIFYARRPEMDTADDKLAFLGNTKASAVSYDRVVPDKNGNWINLTENSWENLIPVADAKTKLAKSVRQEQAIFRLWSNSIKSNRDDWVYDFSSINLEKKVRFFIQEFNKIILQNSKFYPTHIKWSSSLKTVKSQIKFDEAKIVQSTWRPFVETYYYREKILSDRLTDNHTAIYGDDLSENTSSICIQGVPIVKAFSALSVAGPTDYHLIGDAVLLPRYRYTKSGERVDNITDWALKQFKDAYGAGGAFPLAGKVDAERPDGGGAGSAMVQDEAVTLNSVSGVGSPPPPSVGSADTFPARGKAGAEPARGKAGARPITKDAIFHYVYGVLHDPVYREKYAINLKREFPRLPFYPDFWAWAEWGEKLMALHIGYESVEPWELTRTDTPDVKASAAGIAPKAMLKADKDNGQIRLDSETVLTGIPREAWDYRLGNRSGLEWILDQYKEKTPKDPTIREKFNTYRFADYKEKVVDLLMRVCRVSVETVAVTEAMKAAKR